MPFSIFFQNFLFCRIFYFPNFSIIGAKRENEKSKSKIKRKDNRKKKQERKFKKKRVKKMK
jgi:hypothetical protein